MLSSMKTGLRDAVNKLLHVSVIDNDIIKEFVKDIQRTLIRADVNVKLVLSLSSKIENRALNEKPPLGLPRKDHIVKILYEEISHLLGTGEELNFESTKSYIILLLGIQGSGKTTTASKLSRFFLKKGFKPGIICADNFRPGAINQLEILCSKINVEVYSEKNADPIDIINNGITSLKSKGINVIIVDTSGRHKAEESLLKEMKLIANAINPNLTLLVIDGTIGQQCYAQSEAFSKSTDIGGILITKLDGASKGGGALSAAAATGAKIMFIGTGERIDDLELFSSTRFVGRLLGMGDLQSLLSRAKDLEIQNSEEDVKRMMSGKLTINDFFSQIEQVNKLGSLNKLVDMIPGFSNAVMPNNVEELEQKMKKWRVIIQSMTNFEKDNPDVLNSSRIKRIAKGSGNSEKDVKEMFVKFKQSKSVMKASKGREFQQMMRRIMKE